MPVTLTVCRGLHIVSDIFVDGNIMFTTIYRNNISTGTPRAAFSNIEFPSSTPDKIEQFYKSTCLHNQFARARGTFHADICKTNSVS